jgi:hypothetical protein
LFYLKVFYVHLFYWVRFAVAIAVHMKITVFWYVMPCIFIEHYQHVGWICCLCLMSKRISQPWEKLVIIYRDKEDQDRDCSESVGVRSFHTHIKKLHGLSPRANYTNQATAIISKVSANVCR